MQLKRKANVGGVCEKKFTSFESEAQSKLYPENFGT
jgi:hypothetical protein